MIFRLKEGVTLNGVQPEIVLAIMLVNSVYQEMGLEHTVTSITDGQHKVGSLHYAGLAFDNRTWADKIGTQLPEHTKREIADRIRTALGAEFDVVVEATHIHCEMHIEND